MEGLNRFNGAGSTPLWGVLFRHAKNIRICSSGELGFRLRGVDLFTTTHFQKQAGIQERVLTYINIANAMVKYITVQPTQRLFKDAMTLKCTSTRVRAYVTCGTKIYSLALIRSCFKITVSTCEDVANTCIWIISRHFASFSVLTHLAARYSIICL